jgi:hypothetical protein
LTAEFHRLITPIEETVKKECDKSAEQSSRIEACLAKTNELITKLLNGNQSLEKIISLQEDAIQHLKGKTESQGVTIKQLQGMMELRERVAELVKERVEMHRMEEQPAREDLEWLVRLLEAIKDKPKPEETQEAVDEARQEDMEGDASAATSREGA